MAIISAITSVLTSIGVAIAGAAGATLGTAAFSAIVGSTVIGGWAAIATGLVFGGIALSKSASGSFDYQSPVSSSPTYGSGVIQTQTNNNLPIPLIYGYVKCAGNRLWQNDSGESKIKRLVSFGWGEIGGYSDIKLNDIAYNDSGINATITQYTGTSSQVISSLIPGSTNAERAQVVGGLKNIAYLAIEVSKSDKVNENYNLTAVVQGLKVKQYTDEDTFTTSFSNNTAWCLLDLLTNYNGLRLGRDSNNTFDNDLLKEIVDIQSFIDAADYCDDLVGYYAKTTNLTGDNNDLIWQGRASGDNGITITYVDPGPGHATATIALDVDNNIVVTLANPSGTITTTANDIIDLVNNDPEISALVRVMSADGNDGTGVVTAMTQQALMLDEAVTRYTFNMIFDSKFSIRDAVEEFKLNCNGAFVVKDGKLQFKIDKPETSSQTFTTKDIKRGSLKEWFEPRGDRYDVLKVEYIDPTYDYSKVEAHIERTTPFNTPIIDHKIQCYSVNNFFHASRLGKLYMLRSELCPRFISFTTGYQAVGRQIGDVITLTYEKGSTTIFDAKLFKIYMIVDNQKGELEIYCREYDERIYTDELGSFEPVINQITINPQAKLRSATFVIASPDSKNKEQADYIVNNDEGAEVVINNAINQLPLQVVETGTAGAGTTKNNIVLDDAIELNDGDYNGMYIRFTSGDCVNETPKLIENYVGSTKAATVEYKTEIDCFYDCLIMSASEADIKLLSSKLSVEDNYYNGCKIYFPSTSTSHTITNYDGDTKTATITPSLEEPQHGNNYIRECYIYRKDEFTNTPAVGDDYEILSYGGSILFLEGNYDIYSPILLKNGAFVEGLGDGSVINFKFNDTDIIGRTIVDGDGTIGTNYDASSVFSCFSHKEHCGGKNVNVYDLKVKNKSSSYYNCAFNIKEKNCIISNIEINDFDLSIAADASQYLICTNCKFINTKNILPGQGANINNSLFLGSNIRTETANNVSIQNNVFKKCEAPIYLESELTGYNVSNNNFTECISSALSEFCIYAQQISNSSFTNNLAVGNDIGFISIDPYHGSTVYCNNLTIIGNSSVNNLGTYDYNLQFLKYCNVQNNTARAGVSSPTDYAMYLAFCEYCVISNNDLKGMYSNGTATFYEYACIENIKNNNRT